MSERVLYAVLGPGDCVERAGSIHSLEGLPPGAYQVLPPSPRAYAPGVSVIFLDRPRPVAEVGQMMRLGNMLVERPRAPSPVAGAGYVDVPTCPPGSVITVTDLAGREIMAEIEAGNEGGPGRIEFPDAGEYLVSVEAPAPYLETQVRVFV